MSADRGVWGHYCHGREAERGGAAEASVVLKDLKLDLYADMQNTERLKMAASVLLLPNTDKIHVFPSCLYVPGCEVHSY